MVDEHHGKLSSSIYILGQAPEWLTLKASGCGCRSCIERGFTRLAWSAEDRGGLGGTQVPWIVIAELEGKNHTIEHAARRLTNLICFNDDPARSCWHRRRGVRGSQT